MNKSIIIALDFETGDKTLQFLDRLDPTLCRVKVGKELFTAAGPQLVKELVSREFDVFLDLKFHDIPNTVARAVSVAADLGVWMVNVHVSGGRAMLESARQALDCFGTDRPFIIGVTVLTSLANEDLKEVGMLFQTEEQVSRLAFLARESGLDGVVCSAAETKLLRAQLPDDFMLVTPGIRRPEDASGDQKRVVGPTEAIQNGSNFLVIGRPITRSDSPSDALVEFNSAVSGAR